MASVEEAKQFLLKNNAGDGNVYEHLAECLLKVLAERPGDALSLFENISASVKADKLRANEEAPVEDESVKAGQDAWTKASAALLIPLEGEVPADVQDLVDASNMFEWAGVGFGREETFRLALSMKKLAFEQADTVTEVALFGKILGTDADYYVVGGKSGAAEEAADGNDMEGTDGANRMCYFVCSKIGDEWVKLPDVTSAQIVASRQLKKFFSGNLDKKITGYPPFPGTERNLLRAVIGDISASCESSPAGVFLAEEGEVSLNEEAPERSVDEMSELQSWEHLRAGLNAYGRCTKLPEKEDEAGEAIVDENEPEVQEVLRPLSGDEDGTWTTRICPSQGGSQALVVLKSLLFPGASTVAFSQKFVNIYVGYGHRVSSKTYSPPAPGAVLGEMNSSEFVEEGDMLEDPNPPEDETNDD